MLFVVKSNSNNHFGALPRQNGSASLYAVVVGMSIALVSTAILLSVQTEQLNSQESAYFSQVKDKSIECIERVLPMQNWFYNNAELGQNYDSQLAGLCGLPTQNSIRYQVSNLLSSNNISYRVLSYWIGPYSKVDATIFNRVSGTLILDPASVNGSVVSSFQMDKDKVAKTYKLMRQIAHSHQLRFNTMFNTSGDAGFNFFRATNCNDVTDGEIPCSDSAMGGVGGWKNINAINNSVVFSDMTPYSNLWGIPITYCNTTECSASITAPYSILFSTTTPWGVVIASSSMQNI